MHVIGNWQDYVFPRMKSKDAGRHRPVSTASSCSPIQGTSSSFSSSCSSSSYSFSFSFSFSCSLIQETWCKTDPDKAGQQNLQTLFCPPLIPSSSSSQSSNLSAHHWFVFIRLFLPLSWAVAYFIQLSRPFRSGAALDGSSCQSKTRHSLEALTWSNLTSPSLPYVRTTEHG